MEGIGKADNKFDEWAIIDLFGHQKIAGRVSEQQIGGASFVRVDVPLEPPFTKLFGAQDHDEGGSGCIDPF
ncbi:MAG: hypothetical protein PHD04_03970 [Candidatus Pacebacteria bacterium]|nr:hypothetical protein [Candidatus Paceibacterota bacterium]